VNTLMPRQVANQTPVWVESLTPGVVVHAYGNNACLDMTALRVTGTDGYLIFAVEAHVYLAPQWSCRSCWPGVPK